MQFLWRYKILKNMKEYTVWKFSERPLKRDIEKISTIIPCRDIALFV